MTTIKMMRTTTTTTTRHNKNNNYDDNDKNKNKYNNNNTILETMINNATRPTSTKPTSSITPTLNFYQYNTFSFAILH